LVENKNYSNDFGKKRNQIARAAAELFIRKGFLKTTVREIARNSGMSIGTLYHYASSKDDILAMFQDVEIDSLRDFFEDSSTSMLQMSPVEALCHAIETYFTQVDIIQDIIVFWYQETKNLPPTQRSKLLRNEELLTEVFKKIVKAGCDCGEFNVKDITLAANNIIVLGDMWAFRRWLIGRNYTIKQYIEKQTAFVLYGLRHGRY